ncbi:MAG: inosine/xanthosine triphosphatase [Myxococcota bacterium]|nr:inosine/xanthosine triphosphatase [Myxococcota bacterium]
MSAGPLAGVRRVRVGSTNPPKLEGVRAALRAFAPAVSVEGVAVPSGVPDQPLGFEEIARGARARASAARAAGACDLAVGYEDGLVRLPLDGAAGADGADAWMNVGCAAVCDGRRVFVGLSSGFAYPPEAVAPAVEARAPIGEVFDRLWAARGRDGAGEGPSARGLGNVGRLTDGALPRAEYTRHAVLCALVPFLHPDLYARPGDAA